MHRLLPLLLLLGACAPAAVGEGEDEASVSAELSDPAAPVYPADQAHSPLTSEVVANLKATLARGHRDPTRFAKIGDSMTVSTSFAGCFAKDAVSAQAGARHPGDDVVSLEATRLHFAASKIGSTSSFDRVSQAATVGWMAKKAIAGTPSSPLDREIATTNAAFAVVMMGANDTWAGSSSQFRSALTKIVDRLLTLGVVPLLSTIPPRGDATPNALVPTMNAIIRNVAEQKRVPLMDLWLGMTDLPSYGLGTDRLHPSAGGDGCDFSVNGMRHGYNHRNLLLIEALDRMRTQVLEDGAVPHASGIATVSEAGTCFSYTLQATVPDAECVQSITNSAWYQCAAGTGWLALTSPGEGPRGACTVEHAL